MKNKKLLIIIALLIVLTAIIAVTHLTTRTPEIEGEVLVNGESVKIASFDMSPVSGTIVNGKGEETQIDAQGVALSEVCSGDFDSVTVTAADEYHASVNADEIQNAYLILNDDGSLQLIVFGDANQKRCVRNVARIDTE